MAAKFEGTSDFHCTRCGGNLCLNCGFCPSCEGHSSSCTTVRPATSQWLQSVRETVEAQAEIVFRQWKHEEQRMIGFMREHNLIVEPNEEGLTPMQQVWTNLRNGLR